MAITASVNRIDLSDYASGGTLELANVYSNLAVADYVNLYVLYNATTLSGTIEIVAKETPPISDSVFVVILQDTITVSSGGVTFMGESVASEYLQGGMMGVAYWDGSAYVTLWLPSVLLSQVIAGGNIKDASISLAKFANLTAGYFILGNPSNRPTATQITGDITVDSSGASTIVNAAVNAAKMASDAVETAKIKNAAVTLAKLDTSLQPFFSSGTSWYLEVVDLDSAAIQGLGTQYTFVAAQAGKIIKAQAAFGVISGVGTPYATHTTMYIGSAGATEGQLVSGTNGLLLSSADSGVNFEIKQRSGVSVNQYRANQGLAVWVDGGNPTAGDGTVKLYVWYSIVDA